MEERLKKAIEEKEQLKTIEEIKKEIYYNIANSILILIRHLIEYNVKEGKYTRRTDKIYVKGSLDATRFNYDLGNSSIKKSADTLNNNYFKLTDGTDGCSVTVLAVMPNLGREKVPFSFGKRETTTFQMRTSSEWKMIYQILRQMAEKEEIGINYEFLYGQEEPGKTIGAKVFVRQGTASEGELRTWDYNRGSFPKVEVRINFSYSFSY